MTPDADTEALVAAALRRGIPVTRMAEAGPLVQLGCGANRKRIVSGVLPGVDHVAALIAAQPTLAKALLQEAGLPVPDGELAHDARHAVAIARRLGAAVVVKPLDASRGAGVSPPLAGADAVRAAFERARRLGAQVVVERHLEGAPHRVLVVDGRFVAAARRAPPAIVGDGTHDVLELVQRENAQRSRRAPIRIDEATHEVLARQGLGLHAVPPAGMRVALRDSASLQAGGTAEDVSATVHPAVAAACVRAADRIGLATCSVDLVCRDIGQPLDAQGGGIVGIDAAPAIAMHADAAAEAILDMLFPRPRD